MYFNRPRSDVRVGMRVALLTLTCLMATLALGCRALNENPNNKRYWFPTLAVPTAEEKAARAYNFPEGGDPYVDAQVGPKSFDTRPRGWDVQRGKTANTLGVLPDVSYDD